MENLNEIITNVNELSQQYIDRDGFLFTSITEPTNVFDSIVLRNPEQCECWTPKMAFSRHSLNDHINFINRNNIEKALIIAEDINFIVQCPSLKYIKVIPADTAGNGFDYSPLYKMPELRYLQGITMYGSMKEEKITTINYSKINKIEKLSISGTGHLNWNQVDSLTELSISNLKELTNFKNVGYNKTLHDLTITQCGIKSLEGIENFSTLQSICLWYNRKLFDITELSLVGQSLRVLDIENCPKITDFSVLKKLKNLEILNLSGNNELPDLSFIKEMKQLKMFIFSMNVKDGNLSQCLDLPYAYSKKNRKHYNLKDKELPKKQYS